jgi:hypothetical protein
MATRRTDLAYRIHRSKLLILIKEDWHVLIQHTGCQSKLLILIKEDWHVLIQHTGYRSKLLILIDVE